MAMPAPAFAAAGAPAALLEAGSGWQAVAFVLAAAGLGLCLGLLVNRLVGLAGKAAQRTKTTWDDALVASVKPGVPVALMAVAFWLAFDLARDQFPGPVVRAAAFVAFALFAWGVANFLVRVVRTVVDRRIQSRPQMRGIGPVVRSTAGILLYTVAALVVLGSFGVEITPVLASLGIGGLAVALALQDSLSNFFAGLWLRTGGNIRPGHFVRMEKGRVDGFIHDLQWRTTRILTLNGDLVIVPNAVLAQEIVTNFDLPDAHTTLRIQVSAARDADADHLVEALADEARQLAKEEPIIRSSPPPVALFLPGATKDSLEFTVVCQISQAAQQEAIQDLLRRRLLRRIRRERADVPPPVRAGNVGAEHASGPRQARPTAEGIGSGTGPRADGVADSPRTAQP